VLAGLQQSPTEPRWAFDFVPTSTGGTRRRGKRGGKRHKNNRASQRKPESRISESITALCQRFAALRLNDDGPTKTNEHKPPNQSKSVVETNAALSFETNRPHWAPQFRPNSMPATSITAQTSAILKETSLSKEPQRCLPSPKAFPTSVESLDMRKKEPRFFPLSAFLACPDPMGRYPSKSKFSEAKPKYSISHTPDTAISIPPATHAQRTAVSAACCALTLRKNSSTRRLLDKTLGLQQSVPVVSPTVTPASGLSCRPSGPESARETSSSSIILTMDQTVPRPTCPGYDIRFYDQDRSLPPSVATGSSSQTESSPFLPSLPLTTSATASVPLPKPSLAMEKAWKDIDEEHKASANSPSGAPTSSTDPRWLTHTPLATSNDASSVSLAEHQRRPDRYCKDCWCSLNRAKHAEGRPVAQSNMSMMNETIGPRMLVPSSLNKDSMPGLNSPINKRAHNVDSIFAPPTAEQPLATAIPDRLAQFMPALQAQARHASTLHDSISKRETIPGLGCSTRRAVLTPPSTQTSQSLPSTAPIHTLADTEADADFNFSDLGNEVYRPEDDGWTNISSHHSRASSSAPPSPMLSRSSSRNIRAAASKLEEEDEDDDYDVLPLVQQYIQSYPSPMSSWVMSSPDPSMGYPDTTPTPSPPSADGFTQLIFENNDRPQAPNFFPGLSRPPLSRLDYPESMLAPGIRPPQSQSYTPQPTVEDEEEGLQDYESI
jgi:hypothetical protein